MDRLDIFQRERPRLLSLALRVLGSQQDAEDVLQEAWLRYDRADTGGVRNVAAWLTTVTTRLCLDALRRRRELPEEPDEQTPATDDGPEDVALLASELATAFTVVLDELTPPQRVALVLHDVFGVPFGEVAAVLGTTADAAKKLASRARGRVRLAEPPDPDPARARRVVAEFLHAAQHGDVDRLVALLDPDVVRTADPQVLPPGAAHRVHGAPAVVAETVARRATARHGRVAWIDGRPGIVVRSAEKVVAALVFQVAGERITGYDVIADPRRLALLRIS